MTILDIDCSLFSIASDWQQQIANNLTSLFFLQRTVTVGEIIQLPPHCSCSYVKLFLSLTIVNNQVIFYEALLFNRVTFLTLNPSGSKCDHKFLSDGQLKSLPLADFLTAHLQCGSSYIMSQIVLYHNFLQFLVYPVLFSNSNNDFYFCQYLGLKEHTRQIENG